MPNSFYSKKYFNLIRKGIISSEKMRNSGNYIIHMIMLTRSSERIFNPTRYSVFFITCVSSSLSASLFHCAFIKGVYLFGKYIEQEVTRNHNSTGSTSNVSVTSVVTIIDSVKEYHENTTLILRMQCSHSLIK